MRPVFPSGNCHKIGDNVEIRCDFNDVKWKGDRSERTGCEGEKRTHTQHRQQPTASQCVCNVIKSPLFMAPISSEDCSECSLGVRMSLEGLEFSGVNRNCYMLLPHTRIQVYCLCVFILKNIHNIIALT